MLLVALIVVNCFQWQKNQQSRQAMEYEQAWVDADLKLKQLPSRYRSGDRIDALMSSLETPELVAAITDKINELAPNYLLLFRDTEADYQRWFIYSPDASQTLVVEHGVRKWVKNDSDERVEIKGDLRTREIEIPARSLQVLWLRRRKTEEGLEVQFLLNEETILRQPFTGSYAHSHSCSNPGIESVAAAGVLTEPPFNLKQCIEKRRWLRLTNYNIDLNSFSSDPHFALSLSADLRTSGDLYLVPDIARGSMSHSLHSTLKQIDIFVDKNWDENLKLFRIDPADVENLTISEEQDSE